MMVFTAPETWIYNVTMITLVFIIEDELEHRVAQKRIKPGGYVAVSYRKGHGTVGLKKHFWVHPENRPDLRGPKIMPSQVFEHANIIVGYKLGDHDVSAQYHDGASVGYRFEDRTMFRRIGLVRRVDRICASLPKFGNCYHRTPGQTSTPAQNQASTSTSTQASTSTPVLVHALGKVTTAVDAMVMMLAPAPARPVTQASTHAPTPPANIDFFAATI